MSGSEIPTLEVKDESEAFIAQHSSPNPSTGQSDMEEAAEISKGNPQVRYLRSSYETDTQQETSVAMVGLVQAVHLRTGVHYPIPYGVSLRIS